MAQGKTNPLRVRGRHEGAEHGEVLVHLFPPVTLHSDVSHPLVLHLFLALHSLGALPLPPSHGLPRPRRLLSASSSCTRRRRRIHIPVVEVLHRGGATGAPSAMPSSFTTEAIARCRTSHVVKLLHGDTREVMLKHHSF